MHRPVGPPHVALNTRRRLLAGGVLALAGVARANDGASHFPFGRVLPPRALDAWPVTTHRGVRAELPALLAGQVSAVQLMFTGCGGTCPIQGALFAAAQQALGGRLNGAQFLSVSIDALGDTPAALAAWLAKFGAGPGWLAVLPQVRDVDAIVERLGRGGEKRPAGPDPHTGQVHLFDRRARLVYRTPSLPKPAQIATLMREIDAAG